MWCSSQCTGIPVACPGFIHVHCRYIGKAKDALVSSFQGFLCTCTRIVIKHTWRAEFSWPFPAPENKYSDHMDMHSRSQKKFPLNSRATGARLKKKTELKWKRNGRSMGACLCVASLYLRQLTEKTLTLQIFVSTCRDSPGFWETTVMAMRAALRAYQELNRKYNYTCKRICTALEHALPC